MKVTSYNPNDGSVVAESITGLNFGNVRQGRHNVTPPIIKAFPTTENTFTEMKLFLQNNGGLNQSQFGHYKNTSWISGVTGGHPSYFTPSNHFTMVTGPVLSGSYGLDIALNASGVPNEFVWLDIEVGATEVGFTSTINYRFLFDFT